MQNEVLGITFGDSEMTYIQFMIVQGNTELFKKVIETESGR